MRTSLAFSVSVFLTAACGPTSFSVVDSGSSTPDAKGKVDASAPDAGQAVDAHVADAKRAEAAPNDAHIDAPLSPTIYVDKTSTCSPPDGTEACPYLTVAKGLTAAATTVGAVTVHVSGGKVGSPEVYSEGSILTVLANVTLQGSGDVYTTITASGMSAVGPCGANEAAICLEGTLENVTVTSPAGNGVVTPVPAPSAPVPLIRNAVISSSKLNGVLALGSVDLGPNIGVSQNSMAGVESPATSAAGSVVHVIAGLNTFDKNMTNGIDLSGGATLAFEGGEVSNNAQGIRLASSPPGSHSLSSLIASGNAAGVVVYPAQMNQGQNLTLRNSNLRGNSVVGLIYTYAGGSTLDIGDGASGGNIFGGTSASKNDKVAGLLVCGAGNPGSLVGQGDTWSACPPSEALVPLSANGCSLGGSSTVYADIMFQSAPGSLGDPLSAPDCMQGN
jgi:hypothetical protein